MSLTRRLFGLVIVLALLAACAPPSAGLPEAGDLAPQPAGPDVTRVPEPVVPVAVVPAASSASDRVRAAVLVPGATSDYELQPGEAFVLVVDAAGSLQLGVLDAEEVQQQAVATPMPAKQALTLAENLSSGTIVPLIASDINAVNDYIDGEAWAADPVEVPIPPGVIFCPAPDCTYAACEVYAETVYVMPTGRLHYADQGGRWDLRLEVSINARRVAGQRVGIEVPKLMWISISSIRLVEGAEAYRQIMGRLRERQAKRQWRLVSGGQALTTITAATAVVVGVTVFVIVADGPTPDDAVWLVVLRGVTATGLP
jgi:hypothetical protein